MTTTPQDIIRLAYGQLIQTMELCQSFYTKLIEAAETKRKLILAGDSNELGNCIKVENELVSRFADCESSVRNAALKLQRALGVETDETASLTEIRLMLDQERQDKLLQMQQQLNQLAKRLHEINESNQLLMKQELALIHDMLDSILGSAESDYIYDNPKAQSLVKRPSGIDYRT